MSDASQTGDTGDLVLSWSGRWTLTYRILAVNILTLLLLALSIIYLDVFRNRLSKERVRQTKTEAVVTAAALTQIPAAARPSALGSIGRSTSSRIRLYAPDGQLVSDSWRVTGPTYRLVDPQSQGWQKNAARTLDRAFNALVGASPLDDFAEPKLDRVQSWPEALRTQTVGSATTKVRNAPDLTPVFSAAAAVGDQVLLITENDRGFTRTVRSQRFALVIAMAMATILSILLSLFLARTIVRPLRRLALAAHHVRLGRAREVFEL